MRLTAVLSGHAPPAALEQIAACHVEAPSYAATHWAQIVAL